MNRTQPHHFLHQLICNTLRCKANVVKGEINGMGVRLARSCKPFEKDFGHQVIIGLLKKIKANKLYEFSDIDRRVI